MFCGRGINPVGVLDDHKHWAAPLHCRGKPRQGSEDSSANLFRIRQAGIPPRIRRKTQQHGERLDHIGTVQIEIAEKVSEALAPREQRTVTRPGEAMVFHCEDLRARDWVSWMPASTMFAREW
jgi:hypothetical protein